MRLATKAALLSGLVFPGLGHFLVKARWRGTLLALASLAALVVIVDIAVKQALTVVDAVLAGDVPPDAASLTELAARSAAGADDRVTGICFAVLAACWVIGIVDSYRLGAKRL